MQFGAEEIVIVVDSFRLDANLAVTDAIFNTFSFTWQNVCLSFCIISYSVDDRPQVKTVSVRERVDFLCQTIKYKVLENKKELHRI